MQEEFKGPVIDFFPPVRKRGDYGTNRIDYGIESIHPDETLIEFRLGRNGCSGSFQIPTSYIDAIYQNSVGGFRICFSEAVGYNGDFAGGIELHFPEGPVNKHHFHYNHIARVWRDGKIIWKNRLIKK